MFILNVFIYLIYLLLRNILQPLSINGGELSGGNWYNKIIHFCSIFNKTRSASITDFRLENDPENG